MGLGKLRTGMIVSLSIAATLAACRRGPTSSESDLHGIVVFSETLVVIDSYGSELGDSLNMIGAIGAVRSSPGGGILVLDRGSSCVRRFGEDGEAAILIPAGIGPGELELPQAMCATPWGRILVCDAMKHQIMTFMLDGTFEGVFMTSQRYVPYAIIPRIDSSFVGSLSGLDMGDRAVMSYEVSLYRDSLVPEVTFFKDEWVFPDADIYTETSLIDFCCGFSGPVYVCPDITSYHIDIYTDEGVLIGAIERSDIARRPKTTDEIDRERSEWDVWLRQDEAYAGDYEPYPFKPVIQIAGVDSLLRLWVRLEDSEGAVRFDIWDGQGRLVGNAIIPWDTESIPVYSSVDTGGVFLITDEDADEVKVFRLGNSISS